MEEGHKITVLKGADTFIDADIAILHVDATYVPLEYIELAHRYPRSINAQVTNISKRSISRNIVSRGDGYDGPVIVKTNGNFGGVVDSHLLERENPARRLIGAARRRLPWQFKAEMQKEHYRVYDKHTDVPSFVWWNSDLVVEKFLPERSGKDYCLRNWIFLGDRDTHKIMYSTSPVVLAQSAHRVENGTSVPDELRRLRRELGFDYGKFDYAICEGVPVLYDANSTPTRSRLPEDPAHDRARILAEALDGMVNSGGV
jgi:hypothetical protein